MSDHGADDEFDETSVPGLWEAASYFMRWLIAMCGDPCAVAAAGSLSRRQRRHVVFWLRPVEALVRRLLVVEAARIAGAVRPRAHRSAPGKAARRKPVPRKRPTAVQNPEDPATWTVRFALPGCPARTADASALPPRLTWALSRMRALRPADPLVAHWHSAAATAASSEREDATVPRPGPLARRIEAVNRVLANPLPHARRLARRLKRDAARIAAACRPPPERRRPRYGERLVRAAAGHAIGALAAFDTS